MATAKVPPHNVQAEQSVLGALLLEKDAVVKVADILRPEHFYDKRHGIIYEAIVQLFLSGVPVDLLTLIEYLKKHRLLKKAGGRAYISGLVDAVPTAAHVVEYAKIVKEHAVRRGLINAASYITEVAFNSSEPITEVLNKSQQKLFEVSVEGIDKGFVHVKDLLEQVYEEAALVSENEGGIMGLPSGFKDLDKMLGGFQKSDLIIVAARPSIGKTSLALDFVRHAAVKLKKNVAIFSLEMSKTQLIQRLLAMESGVSFWNIRTGSFTDEEYAKISDAMGVLSEANIWIDDQPGQNIIEIRTKARRLYLEHGLDLIVLDYLQLVKGNRQESRVQEVSEVSQELKNMARELEVPVIALSQLSRRVEERQDRMPQLSDLRESGALEQDADVVMFIHREEFYDPDTDKKGIAEIKIAKHRNGPTGIVELAFIKEIASFRDLTKEEEQ